MWPTDCAPSEKEGGLRGLSFFWAVLGESLWVGLHTGKIESGSAGRLNDAVC